MGVLFHFFLGFVTSFLGTIFPSMLSMTTVKIGIKESKKKAVGFAAGVSTIVIAQAYIAVAFSKILLSNPMYLNTLQKVGVFVFFGLSFFFFRQAIRSKKGVKASEKKIKGFITGMFFSLLNMFAIPFYVAVTSSLVMMHWYEFEPINNLSFVIGSAFGTFTLLFIYATIAKKIENRMIWLANQMDVILGIVTGFVAVANAIDILT
jgi:threonine/homoserine/homoserine lactone efflux protein